MPGSAAAPLQDATQTRRGAISAGTQAFGGNKTWHDLATFEDVATFRAAAALPLGTTNRRYVDAAAFGFQQTNTGAQNNEAFAEAQAAAVAGDVFSGRYELHLPAGRFAMNFHNLTPGGAGWFTRAAIMVDQSITVRGAGRDQTVLYADGYVEATYHLEDGVGYVRDDLNDDATTMFLTKSVEDIDLKLIGLTIEGPAEDEFTMDQNNAWGIYSSGGGSVTLENVGTTMWGHALKLIPATPDYPGLGTVFKATDCYFRWRIICNLHGGTPTSGDRSDYVNCTFEFNDDAATVLFSPFQSNGANHALYIGNAVGLSTINCKFLKTGGVGGFAWRHFSVEADMEPPYSSSVGDYFGPGCKAAICTHKTFPSTFSNATVNVQAGASGVQAFGTCYFSGCTFTGEVGAVYAITNGSGTNTVVTCRDTVFRGDWLYAMRRTNITVPAWQIGPNVQFIHTSSQAGACIKLDAGEIDIDGAIFSMPDAAAPLIASGGVLRMAHAVFRDTCRNMVINTDVGAVDVYFGPGVRFEGTSGQPRILPPTAAITLHGFAEFPEDAGQGVGFQLSSSTGLNLITGQMQCLPGIGAYTFADGLFTGSLNRDTYEVDISGGVIDNACLRNSFSGGATALDGNRFITATIKLYAVSDFTLSGAGNIRASGDLRPAGSLVELQYFPSDAVWREVGGGSTSLSAHFVDSAAYGVSETKTGAQNNLALAAAAAVAESTKRPLQIPAGTIKFNFHGAAGIGALGIGAPITIRGAGRNATILKADGFVEGTYTIGPPVNISAPNDNGAMMFRCAADAGKIIVTDLTLEGPDVADITMDLNNAWGLWSGGGNDITLERVDTRLWNQSIKCSPEGGGYPGIGTNFRATNCRLGFRGASAYLHVAGTDAERDSADFTDVVFEYNDGGTPIQMGAPTSNGELPCIYVNTGVALSAKSCWFKSAGQEPGATASAVGWLHYGSALFPGQNDVAKYARAIDCIFDESIPQTQMQTASGVVTQVTGCTFKTGAGNSAIALGGPMVAINSFFVGADGAGVAISDDGRDCSLQATNCTFGVEGQGDGYGLHVYRTTAGSKNWRFTNCKFNDLNGAGSNVEWLADAKLILDDCTFAAVTGSTSIYAANGHVALNDCQIDSAIPISADGSSGDVILELNRNRWGLSSRIELEAPTGNAVDIRGSDNLFWENTPGLGEGFAIVASTGVANITGKLLARPGIGTYLYAANLLSVSLNADTFPLSIGGGTIDNITMSGSSAAGVDEVIDQNRFHQARIYLRAKQDFTLSNSGNIVASGAVRTADEIVCLQYFTSDQKWYEV
jgi:hypothetical protein